jgi:hypothetical protein
MELLQSAGRPPPIVGSWRRVSTTVSESRSRQPIPGAALARCLRAVSDPERYRILHRRGRELLDRLATEFAVDRADVTGREPSPLTSSAVAPAVRLSPRDLRAGPQVTVVFTRFPGLAVRCGRWHKFPLPDCGCDACDEDPEQLREQLEDHVGALVSGNFRERLSQRRGVWLVEYDIPGVASGSNEVEYVKSAQGGEWFSSLCGRGGRRPVAVRLTGRGGVVRLAAAR